MQIKTMNSITLNTTSPQQVRGFFWSNKVLTPFKKIIRKKHLTITESGLCYIYYPINHPINYFQGGFFESTKTAKRS